jgi:hypothetical protein
MAGDIVSSERALERPRDGEKIKVGDDSDRSTEMVLEALFSFSEALFVEAIEVVVLDRW